MKKTIFKLTESLRKNAVLCLLFGVLTICSQHAYAQCSLACNGSTQVSLNSLCNSEVTYDMVLNGAMTSCPDGEFKVIITDIAGNVIPTSPYVTDAQIGKTLMVAVRDTSVSNGNECWGNLIVEDKIAPTITCVQDTSVKCYQVESIRPTAFDNCSDVRIELTGQTEMINDCQSSTGLADSILMVVTRTYRAVDAQGMASQECTVRIEVTRLDSLQEIVAPASLLKANNTSLDCAENFAKLPNGHPSPTAIGSLPGTGVPMLDTFALYPSDGQFCNLLVTYTDIPLPPVQCVQKIMRRWDVFEWSCSSTQRQTSFTQMIEIEDKVGPTFTCPDNIIASTSGYECEGYVMLPPLTNLDDNCSPVGDIRVDVDYDGGILLNQNGGLAPIPVGMSTVTYIAYDDCGRSSTCVINVLVEDRTPPVAVCDQNTAVGLTNGGEAYVRAFTFDDGSYDDCALESYVVRRMADAGRVNCEPCRVPTFNEFTYLGEFNDNHYYLSKWAKNARVAHRYADALGGYVYSANTRAEHTAVNDFVRNVAGVEEYYIGYRKETGSSVFTWDDGSFSTFTNWASAQPSVEDRYTLADVASGRWSSVDGDAVESQFIVEIEDVCGFSEYAKFCCEDLGSNPHIVQFRAIDAQGNWNECMVNVEVQDKVPPALHCPNDMTVDCQFAYDPNRLSDAFGMPTILGNCAPLMEMDSITELNQCNMGTITRTFTVMDARGNASVSCTQRITFENDSPFDFSRITGPADVSMPGCGDPSDAIFLPAETGEPNLGSQDACDLVGYNYVDQVFTFNGNTSEPSCFKIIRTFTVIDWCQPGNGSTVPSRTLTQTIKVVDDNEPYFVTDCAPVTQCTFDSQCAFGEITLTQSAEDSICTDELRWRAVVNPFKSSNVGDEIPFSGVGNTATISQRFPVGAHEVTWTFIDRCGNQVTCLQDFTIANCKAPTPYCLNGLAVDLMPMDTDGDGQVDTGMVALWASDFDAGSFHPCPGYEVIVSFSSNVLDTGRVFTCNDFGDTDVMIWATAIDANGEFVRDTAGNLLQAFCNTFIDVQDNMNACSQSGLINRAAINGLIAAENGMTLQDAKVQLIQAGTELAFEMTNDNGGYAFAPMLTGGQYAITPTKEDAHDNGISTLDLVLMQRHILGVRDLETAYKIIAADVNHDERVTGADVVELRKLILGINSEFEQNTSWRFVDAAYAFYDAGNPLAEGFPESYDIISLDADMSVDFTAIKVGDVNNSAALSGDEMTDSRSAAVGLIAGDAVVSSSAMLLPVTIASDFTFTGMQFTLAYDSDRVSVEGITSEVLDITSADLRIEDGLVVVSIARSADIDLVAGAELFVIEYETTVMQHTGLFSISSEVARAEIYDADYTEYALTMTYGATQDEVVLYQNTPNPFLAMTTINVYMPEANAANLTIYDVTGKLVASYNRDLTAGMNTITVNKEDLLTSGVLFYTLSTDNFTATKRMVVLR